MSAYTVPQESLQELLPWLRKGFPASFKVYGDMRSIVAGRWYGTEFVVDKWPDPTAIVEKPDFEEGKSPCKDYLNNTILGVYGESHKALGKLLKLPGVIDWNRPWIFCGVPDVFFDVLKKTAEEHGGSCSFIRQTLFLTGTPENVKPLPVPEGMELSSVTEDLVEKVVSTWKFKAEKSEDYIAALVRQFPSVALQTSTGEYVGHMIGQTYGAIGMLYVEPEFRGQANAKIIITNLAQKFFDFSKEVYVIIEKDNERSIRLHQAVGFKVVPDITVCWVEYMPPKCCGYKHLKSKCCV